MDKLADKFCDIMRDKNVNMAYCAGFLSALIDNMLEGITTKADVKKILTDKIMEEMETK